MVFFKSFETEDHLMGDKKPYWVFFAGISCLVLAIIFFYVSYDCFSSIFNLSYEKQEYITLDHDTGSLIVPFFMGSFIVLWLSFCAFSAIFLEKKWFYLLCLRPPRYFTTKIACYITKVDFDKILLPWDVFKNQEKNTMLKLVFWQSKIKDPVERAKSIAMNMLVYLALIYVCICAYFSVISDKTKFEITHAMITKISSYHFCYGYKKEPEMTSDKDTKNDYKVVYSLKGFPNCPLPAEKYQSKIFFDFPA